MENFHLLIDGSKESNLVLDYLSQQGITPNVYEYTEEQLKENFEHPFPLLNGNLYANSFKELQIPFLIVDEDMVQWGYPSFFGVKSFLRKKISGLDNAKFEKYYSPFWRFPSQDAFYPKIICFDENQQKFLQEILTKHLMISAY
ncbi:MAG: hypothetical protein AABX28_02220 [Nanoarchaeota archaeon]